MTRPAPTAAALRMRRMRQRQREGTVVVPVVIDVQTIPRLLARGRLDEQDIADPDDRAQALGELLDEQAGL